MTDQNQTAPDENKLIAERRAKLVKLRENSKANGHPNDFRREHLSAELKEVHGAKDKATLAEEAHPVSVAGRIMRKGGPFVGIQDSTGSVQIYMAKAMQKESDAWQSLDIGDIVYGRDRKSVV